MTPYGKAIAALLTAVFGLLGEFGVDPEWATDGAIASVSALIGTALVYFVPNQTD